MQQQRLDELPLSPCGERPDDCPAGLWEELCRVTKHPGVFVLENPEVYIELRRWWVHEGAQQQAAPE